MIKKNNINKIISIIIMVIIFTYLLSPDQLSDNDTIFINDEKISPF
jgi:hypothetical protein